MKKQVLIAIAIAISLAGCAVSGTGPGVKKWVLVTEGSELAYEDGLAGLFGKAKLNDGTIVSKAKLDFITRYVNSYEPERRDVILRPLLNAYDITDSLEAREYERKFAFQSAPEMRHPSYNGILRKTSFIDGHIRKGEIEAYFVVDYIAAQPMSPEGFAVVIDGERYQYKKPTVYNPYNPELKFSGHARYRNDYLGQTMCNLHYKKCRELVAKIVDSKEAVVITEFGNGRSVETKIEDSDKQHIGGLLKAIEAIYAVTSN